MKDNKQKEAKARVKTSKSMTKQSSVSKVIKRIICKNTGLKEFFKCIPIFFFPNVVKKICRWLSFIQESSEVDSIKPEDDEKAEVQVEKEREEESTNPE